MFLPKSFVFVHQSDFSLFRPETVLGTISMPEWADLDTILDSKSEKHVPDASLKAHSIFHTFFDLCFDHFGLQKRRPLSSRRPPFVAPKSVSDPVWAIWGPSWPACTNFGSILVVWGVPFVPKGGPCWWFFVPVNRVQVEIWSPTFDALFRFFRHRTISPSAVADTWRQPIGYIYIYILMMTMIE